MECWTGTREIQDQPQKQLGAFGLHASSQLNLTYTVVRKIGMREYFVCCLERLKESWDINLINNPRKTSQRRNLVWALCHAQSFLGVLLQTRIRYRAEMSNWRPTGQLRHMQATPTPTLLREKHHETSRGNNMTMWLWHPWYRGRLNGLDRFGGRTVAEQDE